jgi:hypothetical protein
MSKEFDNIMAEMVGCSQREAESLRLAATISDSIVEQVNTLHTAIEQDPANNALQSRIERLRETMIKMAEAKECCAANAERYAEGCRQCAAKLDHYLKP